jgi:hypothetical protein
VTVWVGSLLAIGYLAAPVLFAQLSDRGVAGNLAGAMFASRAGSDWPAVPTWCFTCCCQRLARASVRRVLDRAADACADRGRLLWRAADTGAAQGRCAAAPGHGKRRLRDRFATWHGVSSALYLVQSLLGIALVVLQERGRGASACDCGSFAARGGLLSWSSLRVRRAPAPARCVPLGTFARPFRVRAPQHQQVADVLNLGKSSAVRISLNRISRSSRSMP